MDGTRPVSDVVWNPVPEGAPATRALEAFKGSGLPLAVVIDERGHIEGVVTLTDVLEAPCQRRGTKDGGTGAWIKSAIRTSTRRGGCAA